MPSRAETHHLPRQGVSERLHTRVVRVFILLTLAPLVLGAIISLVVTISYSRTQVIQEQQNLAVSIGNLLSDRWQHMVADLRAGASIIAQNSPERNAAVLSTLQHGCAACQTIWLVDLAGHLEQQAGEPAPPPVLDAVQRAALARGSEVLRTTPPPTSATSVVVLLVPVRRAGVPAGALLIRVDVQMLGGEALALMQFNHDAYGYITDHDGRLIISPRPDHNGERRDLHALPVVDAALRGVAWEPPQSQVYQGLFAARVDGVWYKMSNPDWYVLVEAPQSVLLAHNWALFSLQGGLVLLTGTAALLLGRRLAATITQPLEQLYTGVVRLQAGDWAQPLRVFRPDEIGHLAQAFNRMAQDLQTKRDDLMAHSDQLRLANRELRHALEEARSANILKSQFVATISHELRTPLTAMLGFSEMLELDMYGSLHDEQREAVSRISANGRHLHELINDLLDFSKLEAGKLTLHEEPFSLRDLVTSVLSLCVPLMEAKALHMHTSVDATLPAIIVGDAMRLRQILLNLLTNATKFTEQGTVMLRIGQQVQPMLDTRTSMLPAAHGDSVGHVCLVIEVADTGIGIAPADHADIFELFRQVDGDYARRQGGTGLGLAITRHLVVLMNGTISVNSQLGAGSCFTITLPLKVEAIHPQLHEVHVNVS
jgi:signal transduction histidine kinase